MAHENILFWKKLKNNRVGLELCTQSFEDRKARLAPYAEHFLVSKNYRIVRKLRICGKFGRFYRTVQQNLSFEVSFQ